MPKEHFAHLDHERVAPATAERFAEILGKEGWQLEQLTDTAYRLDYNGQAYVIHDSRVGFSVTCPQEVPVAQKMDVGTYSMWVDKKNRTAQCVTYVLVFEPDEDTATIMVESVIPSVWEVTDRQLYENVVGAISEMDLGVTDLNSTFM